MFKIHLRKIYSDQHWYGMHYHMSILHKNFIWWLVNGWKTISPSKMLQMFEIHVQKNYSDQHWYEIHYHLSTLHINFIRWLVNGLKISDCHHMNLSPSEKKYHSPIKIIDVTVWTCHHLKKYSFSYQYEYVTIWYVTIWIIFISVTILVWNFQMVTGMNSSYQASIRWHLSPYGGLVWKFFIPVTKKPVQMVTVW